jgi:hypothetical protein
VRRLRQRLSGRRDRCRRDLRAARGRRSPMNISSLIVRARPERAEVRTALEAMPGLEIKAAAGQPADRGCRASRRIGRGRQLWRCQIEACSRSRWSTSAMTMPAPLGVEP